jgi:serine/threonine protein kinase
MSVPSRPTTVTNLRNADILHWWRNGIQLNLPDAFLVVTLSNEVDNSPRIEIKTSTSVPGRKLLVFTVEHIEALITEWFHGLREGKVSQFIPCTVCEEKGFQDSHVFTLEECLKGSDSSGCVECPRHRDVPVKLGVLAPDISLHDVHPDLLFEHHELHYDEKSIIKEGSFGKVIKRIFRLENFYLGFILLRLNYFRLCRILTNIAYFFFDLQVYRAVLKKPTGPPKLVAIKEYKGDDLASFRELRKEINVLRRIIHPNLVQMIGVAQKPRCMAFELADYGSLDDILFDTSSPQDESISRLVLIVIAKEIANALALLHWHKIIHRDLKPSNVLIFSLKLEDSVHVKISDFGTANFAGPWGMKAPVTRTHMRAPEVLEFALKEEYSIEVDIYSFAILLYAMITRERAFDDLSSSEIRPAVLQHKRPPWRNVDGAMNKLVNLTRLMCVSWSQNPQDRPTAEQCRTQLGNPGFQALMSKLAFPPENTVYFVHFVPCQEELWVVHRLNAFTLVSVFTSNLSSNTKYCFEISANEDLTVESACCHYDIMMVIFLREKSMQSGMFKMYSFTDSSLLSSVNCEFLLPAVNGIAASNSHIFVATDRGCYTANIDHHTSGLMATNLLTQTTVESILLSNSKLWMSSNSSVVVYSILMDSQLEPLYDRKELPIPGGVKQLHHSHEEEDTVWALTYSRVLCKLNEDQILRCIELQNCLNNHEIPLSFQGQVTCLLPAGDVIWLGLSTGVIVIIDHDTGQLITGFQPYSGPVSSLVLSPATQLPMVISCGRATSDCLGTDDSVIFPLAIDSSELIKVAARKPSRIMTNIKMNFEGNWDDVKKNGFSDVLLAWHAISSKNWKRIQRASENNSRGVEEK